MRLRLFFAVAGRTFGEQSTYRMATLAGVVTNTVFGFIRASVLLFLADGAELRGMSPSQLVTFAFVSQGLLNVIGGTANSDFGARVQSGAIVVDFYRPADIQAWWLARWLGQAAFQVVFRGLPPILIGALAYPLVWPTPSQIPLIAVSVLVATMLGFSLRFISGLTAFWHTDNRGAEAFLTVLIFFFSGLMLPLNLFPPALEATARALPFASMLQLPAELYLGLTTGPAALGSLAQQALWLVVLLAVGRAVLHLASQKVVIQGG